MNPYLKELYNVIQEQLALIYWELYLEDFGKSLMKKRLL